VDWYCYFGFQGSSNKNNSCALPFLAELWSEKIFEIC
jgi:hypothetical protein